MKSVVLITGTSTGLGIALSIQFAQAGHEVYATMRNTGKKEALLSAARDAGVNLNLLALDVQDKQSVTNCVEQIIQTHGRIDILVNNAGAGCVRTTEHITEEEADWVMDVNFHGVLRCTRAVLPHMRAAGEGRIINIGSVGGLVGQPFSDIYCAAKFAVEGYTESLASYITPNFGIQFCCVEPGGIATEFANNALTQLQSRGAMPEDDYKPVFDRFVASGVGEARGDVYQSAEDVAKVVIEVSRQEHMPLRRRTSPWAEQFTSLKTQADPDGLKLVALVQEAFN